KCYKILGISEDSDQEEIRKAYLKLVKRYHPDSGTEEADADKFSEIDKAFKILINKKSKERWNVDEDKVQEQDIKHTAPQHRQYLSYGGIGIGTPFQRQKQYTKIRAMQAAENVLQHRIAKVSTEEGALLVKTPLKHKIKTKYGFERLVEDLIQESMSKGEFNNLSGTGKPLPSHQNRNPYVDFTTHKLNEVLIDNGFTPEWITLQKEIREDIQKLRDYLLFDRSHLGPYPLNTEENNQWVDIMDKHKELVEQINRKINKFNLVVPIINKQMIQIDLEKEGKKILISGTHSRRIQKYSDVKAPSTEHELKETTNVFGLFELLFKK
ncbi:dnaJ -like subfamily C member 28, partial [Asbolus verrucosus]